MLLHLYLRQGINTTNKSADCPEAPMEPMSSLLFITSGNSRTIKQNRVDNLGLNISKMRVIRIFICSFVPEMKIKVLK